MDLILYARIEALVTEREGMIAHNKLCEMDDCIPAYDKSHFDGIANELKSIGGIG